MAKYKALQEKLDRRQLVYGFMATLADSSVLPLYQADGVDFILYDLEHGNNNLEQIAGKLAICRSLGIPTLVRVQDAIYHLVAKPIDLGADGILLPRTETKDQVKTALSAIRFTPLGRKGCGGSHQFRPGETFAQFQEGRLLFLQIESPLGVQNLPGILDLYREQLAGVIIGPYDMSVQAGTPLDPKSPAVMEQIRQTSRICAGYELSCGIFCDDLDQAALWAQAGMNILWTSSDSSLLQAGLSAALDRIGQLRQEGG